MPSGPSKSSPIELPRACILSRLATDQQRGMQDVHRVPLDLLLLGHLLLGGSA